MAETNIHIAENQERRIYGIIRMCGSKGKKRKIAGYQKGSFMPYAAVENLYFFAACCFTSVILPVDFRRRILFSASDRKC